MEVVETIQAHSLAARCLLVSVSIAAWSGRKYDRVASVLLESEHNAEAGRARVNKLLIRAEALQPVTRAANAIRMMVYDNTLPWADNGERIIAASHYLGLANKLRPLIEDFNAQADALAAEYAAERERARFELNKLFRASDYPAEIRSRYHVRVSVMPIADSSDMRLEIPESVQEAVRLSVEETLQTRQREAMETLWGTLGTSLVAIRDRLAEKDARFKTALIENFHGLIDRLGALNIVGDPQVDALQMRVRDSLGTFDIGELRSDPAQREAFVEKADEIIDTFQAMWGKA